MGPLLLEFAVEAPIGNQKKERFQLEMNLSGNFYQGILNMGTRLAKVWRLPFPDEITNFALDPK